MVCHRFGWRAVVARLSMKDAAVAAGGGRDMIAPLRAGGPGRVAVVFCHGVSAWLQRNRRRFGLGLRAMVELGVGVDVGVETDTRTDR